MPASRIPQSDLFALSLAEDRPDTAVWWALPEGTRRSLAGLLARLLFEHRANARRGGGRRDHCDKIKPHHLARRAIVYVRQSSAHQVLHNPESRALQYGMRDRLAALGWSEIEVVDDDLGRSAAGGVARAGFERMVAEVCLGKVGAVAAREVSRFARNSHDWQQLMRCAGWSTPCWWTGRRCMLHETATTGSCSGSRAA
jgi:hypothetical protein